MFRLSETHMSAMDEAMQTLSTEELEQSISARKVKRINGAVLVGAGAVLGTYFGMHHEYATATLQAAVAALGGRIAVDAHLEIPYIAEEIDRREA